jgi:ubiquinone/menaquinone biosynthesis C-methylase UbiE
VIPANEETGWFAQAARTGGVCVRWEDGHAAHCAAQVVFNPEEVERVHSLFRAKYGAEVWCKYFGRSRKALAVEPGRAPVERTPEEMVQAEFDTVAPGYEASVARRPIERYLKDRVAALFERSLYGLDPLLEIGPGTGYHTLRLLKAGHRIVAVDVSERMLSELSRRTSEANLAGHLETRLGRFAEIDQILRDFPDGSFRAAYSAFGAFNLEREVERASAALARLISPGGRLVFTSLNRPGLMPTLWELAAGRPAAAARRINEVIPAGGIRYPLELYVRTPSAWDRLLRSGFRRQATQAVSVLAPPFDSDRLLAFLGPEGGRRIRSLDLRIAACPSAWVAAEWVYLTYVRSAGQRRSARPLEARAEPQGSGT